MLVSIRTLSVLGCVAVLSATGCNGGDEVWDDESDEAVGEARTAQLDGGVKVWRVFNLYLQDTANTELGQIHLYNERLGTFRTGLEYWYVNRAALAGLGTYGIDISYQEEDRIDPPAAPTYTYQQDFSVDRYVNWGTGWTSDPTTGGGTLHQGNDGIYLRLQKSTTTPPSLTGISWIQVQPSSSTVANVTPDAVFSTVSSVFVGTGHVGYSITQQP